MEKEMNKKQQFFQIKNIFAKIISEKDVVEKFKNKASVSERFNFTKELGEKLGLPCDYDEQTFEKFDFLLSVISEINLRADLLEKFKKLNNIDEISSFIDETINSFFKNSAPVKLEKDDLEAFVFASSTDRIPPENTGSVAGGFGLSSVLGGYQTIGALQHMGTDLGSRIADLVLAIKS